MQCIHVSSDQATSQQKAHVKLNNAAPQVMNNPNYRFYGLGLLHFCKNCISSLRHYRLTNMSSSFFVAQLTSVWASNTQMAKKMKAAVPASVFAFAMLIVMKSHTKLYLNQTVSHPAGINVLIVKCRKKEVAFVCALQNSTNIPCDRLLV